MAFINLNFNVDVNNCLSGIKATLGLRRPKFGIKKLEKEMTRLRGKRDDINNYINEAEREGKIPTNQVSQWLLEVKILEGKVAGIKQDFDSMSCFSCNCFNRTGGTSSSQTEAFAANLQAQQAEDDVPCRESNYCSIIWRAAKKLDEANELMSRVDTMDKIAIVGPPEPTMTLPILEQLPIGIESYAEDIVGYIDGEKGNIIGICGMGGVGKTTILKSIQQHYLLKHTIFDHVIWVVASKDSQLKRLQMDIAKSLSLRTLQENDDERTRGDKLFSYLKNKKCLLLLDDIWKNVDRQLFGMAQSVAEQGQQPTRKIVVFTTRSETLCAQMKAEKKIKVKCLDSDRAWQLFEQNSDRDILSSDGGIKFVAEELAKECAGLPLALITVARAMSGKKSWEVWNDALNQIRDNHEWMTACLLEDSSVMYKAFKQSYDSLENDSIRECLLCCALWPEDYGIHQFEELIPCWIGCGIIREFNVINEAFAKGCSHLEALIAASLLEHSSRHRVKMHDVIRDMALLMVSGSKWNKRKWTVQARIGLSHLPRQEEWQEAERASFMWNEISSLQDYEASAFPKLSMLILHRNIRLTTIPSSLFVSMPRLTYLDLSWSQIREVPMEIGCLTELQYLNLSCNPITTLPAEFGCLSKLEYLLLRSTQLKTIPNVTISNLSMLKWLDITEIQSEPHWWLDELKCFKGRRQLSVGISILPTIDNVERLNKLPNVSIWYLTLDKYISSQLPKYDLGTPQWSCNISDKLEFLFIRDLSLRRLMFAAGVGRKSSFGCLKNLHFSALFQLENISLNGVVLRNLRELSIDHCSELRNVSWVLQLPCLSLLTIDHCERMNELISEVGNSNSKSSFSIQKLRLCRMRNLSRIANRQLHFPHLEYIKVTDCSFLGKLPFGAEILKNRLKRIDGEVNWWHRLEWDDESSKDLLAPYFRCL